MGGGHVERTSEFIRGVLTCDERLCDAVFTYNFRKRPIARTDRTSLPRNIASPPSTVHNPHSLWVQTFGVRRKRTRRVSLSRR